MKIAIISMSSYASPPLHYGGEVYIWNLARGLCDLGNEVTLYAAPGSKPPHDDCHCSLKYLPGGYGDIDLAREWAAWDWYGDEIRSHEFIIDCGHAHAVAEEIGWYHPEDQFRTLVVLNGVTSNSPRCGLYNAVVGSQKWKELLLYGRTQFFDTPMAAKYSVDLPSEVARDAIVGVVPWRIDTDFYTPEPDNTVGDYFLWLSRPTDYKGLDDALEVAARLKLNLVVAPGQGNAAHEAELASYRPQIVGAQQAGANVQVVALPLDSSHHAAKRALVRRARGLIYPIKCHEPFGMVVVEALSCGVPVIAHNRGAMPEIIQDRVTGFLCQSGPSNDPSQPFYHDELDQMCDAIQQVDQLDRQHIRADSAERWHYRLSAQQFMDLIKD